MKQDGALTDLKKILDCKKKEGRKKCMKKLENATDDEIYLLCSYLWIVRKMNGGKKYEKKR